MRALAVAGGMAQAQAGPREHLVADSTAPVLRPPPSPPFAAHPGRRPDQGGGGGGAADPGLRVGYSDQPVSLSLSEQVSLSLSEPVPWSLSELVPVTHPGSLTFSPAAVARPRR
jgi:hypothetical protein